LRQVNGRRRVRRRVASPNEPLASKVGRQDDYGSIAPPPIEGNIAGSRRGCSIAGQLPNSQTLSNSNGTDAQRTERAPCERK